MGLSIAALTACEPARNEEYFAYLQDEHRRSISEVVLFADQDSAQFYVASSDPWTAQLEADWASITPTAFSKGGFAVPIKVVSTSPNTTGSIRRGRVIVKTRQDLTLALFHTPWHNIQSPQVSQSGTFETTLHSADSTSLPLVFTLYKNGGSLTTNETWLHLPTTPLHAGTHQLNIPVSKNMGGERTGTITLTAGGVSTTIKVTQPKKSGM